MSPHPDKSTDEPPFSAEDLAYVEDALLRRCSDERSRQKAREIVADVAADCFGATQRQRGANSLLDLYNGRAPIRFWLAKVASSRLINWWRSASYRMEILSDGSELEHSSPAAVEAIADEDTVELLADALERSLSSLDRQQLIFLRLVFIHGVKRETVSRVWSCHPATIGRQITQALEQLRGSVLGYLKKVDPHCEVRWEDCLKLCQKRPGILDGEADDRFPATEVKLDCL